jgi:hypothetical protein
VRGVGEEGLMLDLAVKAGKEKVVGLFSGEWRG